MVDQSFELHRKLKRTAVTSLYLYAFSILCSMVCVWLSPFRVMKVLCSITITLLGISFCNTVRFLRNLRKTARMRDTFGKDLTAYKFRLENPEGDFLNRQ